MRHKRGLFITVEGGEGVGKTTNIQFIENQMREQGWDTLVTREPGGTPMAEEIREILITPRDEAVAPMTELLLIFAARAQHLKQKIEPALSQGKCVISDRFTDATYAYQAAGRELDSSQVSVLENLVQGAFRPDLTVLLDAPIEVGMTRAQARGSLDRFEEEKRSFFERVRACYLDRAKAEPERFLVVDASRELEQVQRSIVTALGSYIKS